ncbi:MAG: hypothetical protein N2315_06100 [Thermanaerothrix sp.]|nr:hypothetical protein [Thermanaerothrix sp.]
MEVRVQIIGPKGSKANPSCCCGGESCDPAKTLEDAAEEIRALLASEGFPHAEVRVEDPSEPDCDLKARQAAEASPELLPLVMLNGRVCAFGGVKGDVLLKLIRKMGGL